MLQLLVLELLALHRHRGEGKSHGLQDRGADLVHAGLADSSHPADPRPRDAHGGQVGLVEEDGLARRHAAAAHHGNLQESGT